MIAVSCQLSKSEQHNTMPVPNQNHINQPEPKSVSLSKLEQSSLSEAKELLGEPMGQDQFILGEVQTEFRVGLNNYYSPEQVEQAKINLLELTWNYDTDNNVTLWYEVTDTSKPIQVYKWPSDALF